MEGCTAPVMRPFPCKRSCTTGAAKQAGVCLVCLLLDTWAGVSPSSACYVRAEHSTRLELTGYNHASLLAGDGASALGTR